MDIQTLLPKVRRTALFLFWAICLTQPAARAQSPLEQAPYRRQADSILRARNADEALGYLRTAKAGLERRRQQESPGFVALLLAFGDVYARVDSHDLAAQHYQAALDLQEKLDQEDKPGTLTALTALADFYERTDPHRAVPFYEQGLALRLAMDGENSRLVARGYYELAIIHAVIREFDMATDYCLQAIRCLRNAGLTGETDYAGYHQVLGWIHQEEGDFPQALQYFQQALDTLQAKLGANIETAKCMSTLGETYAQLGDYEKALEYQRASVAMFEQVDTLGGRYVRAAYTYLGETYNLANQPRQAIESIRRAQFYGAQTGEIRPLQPRQALQLCNAYRLLGDHPQALAFADTALLKLDVDQDRFEYWRVLLAKTRVLAEQFRATKNPDLLQGATYLLALAQRTMTALIADQHDERDLLAIYREALRGFDQELACYTQFFNSTRDRQWLEKALEVSETSKGLLLYQQLLASKSRLKSKIPYALAAEERALQERITAIEKQLFEMGDRADAGEKEKIGEQLFALKNQHSAIRKSMEAVYPDYFATATFPDIRTAAMQAALAPDEGLLEFFTGDSTITAFLLRSDTLVCRKIGPKKIIEADISRFRTSISRYFLSPEKRPDIYLQSAGEYAETAFALYQTLLAPFGPLLPLHLTIVPDGALAYLPFEALLLEKPVRPDRFHLHRYLFGAHVIRYAGSAALLREMETLPPAPSSTAPLLALAPYFDGSTAWNDSLRTLLADPLRADAAPLPFSGEEVYKIARLTGGTALTGAAASKDAFIREAPKYRVLHLATHARANDQAGDYSFLAFAPDPAHPKSERLYVSEIYGLRLQAELVVLSACETGLGQLHRGEGVVSLARAFVSAGAHSIVQSQWVVSDAQTRRMMELFYQHLKEGRPKDTALHLARQDYLKRFQGEAAHPYFWAGFVLTGDKKPLSFEKN